MRAMPPLRFVSPRRRRIVLALAGVAALILCAYVTAVLVGRPTVERVALSRWMLTAAKVIAAMLFVLRAAWVREGAAPWAAMGVATCFTLTGWLVYWGAIQNLDPQPFPSIADGLWLSGYVGMYVGLVLTVRAHSPRFDRGAWLDGAAAVLTLGALSAALVFQPLLETTGGTAAAVITNLAYPLADLVMLCTIAGVFALGGWRLGRLWALVGLAVVGLALLDSVWLYQSSAGTWRDGTLLSAGWPLVMLVWALAGWAPAAGEREIDPDGWPRLVIPAALTLTALGVLLYGDFAPISPVAAVLATAAIVAGAGRSLLTFRRMRALVEHRDRALDAALTDHLTGLGNHRAFHEDLAGEVAIGARPFTLVLLDLVGLKAINDSRGHQAGDERLRTVASRLAGALRRDDRAYRIGGDEFAVMLPGVSAWDGFNLGERVQRSLSSGVPGTSPIVSVGVADAGDGLPKDELIRRADAALIEAKRSHRKTVLYSPDLDCQRVEAPERRDEAHTKTVATALARAVDAKDSYTRSHCETVAETCVLIASRLGLTPDHTAKLRLAGLLHDVGKIGIPDTILQKPDRLTEEEFEVMKTHSQLGHSIASAAGLDEQAEWIRHHHERLDGCGYPDGLAGDEVPLESRIILVADAFEAMTSDRPYRKGRPIADALVELRDCAGSQFDPRCVEALERALAAESVAG